jgi:hypothetical protein
LLICLTLRCRLNAVVLASLSSPHIINNCLFVVLSLSICLLIILAILMVSSMF